MSAQPEPKVVEIRGRLYRVERIEDGEPVLTLIGPPPRWRFGYYDPL